MLSRKNIIIVLLAIGILIGLLSLISIDKKAPLISQNKYKASDSIKSIAKPNWWKEPTASANLTIPTQHSKNVTNQREPVSNFLKMSKSEEWKNTASSGIASAKYNLLFENKDYELAIIRMNAKVPQEEVLSIWQNKVGITPKSPYKSIKLITKYNQPLELITFKGEQKAILLAIHKSHKLTFFRLLSNEGIDEQITQKFKEFLFEIEIIN